METTAPFAGFATLKRTVSLTQVLDRYGLLERLRRSGDQLNGACPLHGGHNPSQFRADLDRNLWVCFGDCQRGGSIIDFVSAKERVGIREAARLIQDWFGVLPGRTTSEPRPEPPPVNGHNPPLQYGLGPLNPRVQLRDVWFLMGQLRKRGLVVCLNPKHTTGKLYTLTSRGQSVASEAFGLPMAAAPTGINWRIYAKVVRAKVRKLVLLESSRLPPGTAATATVIRKRLRTHHAVASNPALRALKDLKQLGLVHAEPASDSDRRWVYRLTPAGQRMAPYLQEDGSPAAEHG